MTQRFIICKVTNVGFLYFKKYIIKKDIGQALFVKPGIRLLSHVVYNELYEIWEASYFETCSYYNWIVDQMQLLQNHLK